MPTLHAQSLLDVGIDKLIAELEEAQYNIYCVQQHYASNTSITRISRKIFGFNHEEGIMSQNSQHVVQREGIMAHIPSSASMRI